MPICRYVEEVSQEVRRCHINVCLCKVQIRNPEETSPEVQNRYISGPTKRTYVLQKIKNKFGQNISCLSSEKLNLRLGNKVFVNNIDSKEKISLGECNYLISRSIKYQSIK